MITSNSVMTLTLKGTIHELTRISTFVEEAGERWALPAKTVLQINLVLDELFTNTVNHGCTGAKDHQVSIGFTYGNDQLTITITDDGKPFDLTRSEDPDIERPPEEQCIGGLGIFLARQYTNEISYQRKNGWNINTLIKSL
jgi:anti-sigma regulatory factor (Ser/Thr protein kinase)